MPPGLVRKIRLWPIHQLALSGTVWCVVAAGLSIGCGEQDESADESSSKAPADTPAESTLDRPVALGATVSLARRYPFEGERRYVRATVSASPTDLRDRFAVVPKGREPFRVVVRFTDRGPDTFPVDWARFALIGTDGRKVVSYSQTPLRRIYADRDRSPRVTILTFMVRKAFEPELLRLSSIVEVWPFQAKWKIDRRGATGAR